MDEKRALAASFFSFEIFLLITVIPLSLAVICRVDFCSHIGKYSLK